LPCAKAQRIQAVTSGRPMVDRRIGRRPYGLGGPVPAARPAPSLVPGAPSFRRFCERVGLHNARNNVGRAKSSVTQPKALRIILDLNALTNSQTSVTTHIPMTAIRSTDAAATEREIPVPNATYAAKHAGHFGSNARTSAGSEHFAQATRRRATRGGWTLPSAASCELLRAVFADMEQQAGFFICGPHSRSRKKPLSAPPQPSLQDSGHDGEPTTS